MTSSFGGAVQCKGGFHEIELVVGVDALFGAVTVNAEEAPERQAISAHPFLRKAAGEAVAFGAHVAPVFVISDGGPRSPGLRRIEDS